MGGYISKSPNAINCRRGWVRSLKRFTPPSVLAGTTLAGADQHGRGVTEDAIWLARVLLQFIPGEAEIFAMSISG